VSQVVCDSCDTWTGLLAGWPGLFSGRNPRFHCPAMLIAVFMFLHFGSCDSDSRDSCDTLRRQGEGMFDPWTATEKDMLPQMDTVFSCETANLQLRQWSSAQHILSLKPKVEAGDGNALLDCVNSLLSSGLTAPSWLAEAFGWRHQAVISAQVGSWDDVFGKPHRYNTGSKRLALVRRKGHLPLAIWHYIRTRLKEDPTLPLDAIFSDAGDKFACSSRDADRYYRKAVALFWEPHEVTDRKHKKPGLSTAK
jgi:hypothetical protein